MGFAAIAPIALMAVSAAVTTYTAYRSADAQQKAATYNAKVQDQNARFAEQQAKDTMARGQDEEDAYRKHLAQLLGTQRTQLAGTGVDLSPGSSALDTLADTAGLGAQDAATIQRNTARAAFADRKGAYNYASGAALNRATAANANPGLSAGLTLLGTSSQMASSWYQSNGQWAPR